MSDKQYDGGTGATGKSWVCSNCGNMRWAGSVHHCPTHIGPANPLPKQAMTTKRDAVQPLPKNIDPVVLHYARLAMATMSTQTFEVFPDGAMCDRQLYDLFVEFKKRYKP